MEDGLRICTKAQYDIKKDYCELSCATKNKNMDLDINHVKG